MEQNLFGKSKIWWEDLLKKNVELLNGGTKESAMNINIYKYIISNENSVEWVWNEMVLRDLLTIKERKKKSGVN